MTARRSALSNGIAIASCLMVVCVFAIPLLPHVPKEELVRPSLWGLAVLAAFAGWGTALASFCVPTRKVAFALRAAWGAGALAFAGGILAALSMLGRGVLYAAVAVGCLLLIKEWVQERATLGRAFLAQLAFARRSPALVCVVLFVGAGLALHYLGAAADTTSNPYDDDIAYYPFAKQLLERGTLIDPFSLRRMSTLGGQAFYQAMLLLRAPILHLNVFDRGICLVLVALLLWSHRVGGDRVPLLARLVSIVFVIGMPNTSINSASYYSGVAFFLALFQTMDYLPDTLSTDFRESVRRCLPLALTGAAICTLRQNYQITVAFFVLFGYAFAVARSSMGIGKRLVEPVTALALIGVCSLPWLVLLYRSNATFLFPVMPGTFRAGLDLRSEGMSKLGLVRFFVDIWMQAEPIQTLPLFFLVGLSVREIAIRRPLASMWLASFVGVALLVNNFSLSDAENLARYDYAFFTAAALVTWQTVSARLRLFQLASKPKETFSVLVQLGVLLFALLYPLETHSEASRKMLETRVADTDELLRRSAPMQLESPIGAAYRKLQEAVPAGERMLVLLDRPYHLDFARNEIWNLDYPGIASPAPGIPCFKGAGAVADYFRAQNIRYVAFVQSEHSSFNYRREIWVEHLWDHSEMWRTYAPYLLDVMDNLAALARTHRHLHDGAGMIVLDLESEAGR